jgi:hypothetical protein
MRLQDVLDQLALQTRRARARIGLERGLNESFWLAVAATAWAIVALAGLHERLPLLAQSLSSLAVLFGLVWLAIAARRAWRAPNDAEARARLAADSKIDSGAFESLRDQPTRYDAFSIALWRRERERASAYAEGARVHGLRLDLDARDPWRLRYVLLLALLATLVFSGAGAPERLARAFAPDPGPLLGDQPIAIEAWATPADYTHAPPISLSDALGQTIATPPSVEVTVRVTGPTGAPDLVFQGSGRNERVRFLRAADGAWEARMAIPGPGTLKIVRFHSRGFWRLAPAVDRAPDAEFTAPMATLPDERAAISWRASDDFGVRRLVLRVQPLDPPPGLTRADPVDIDIETPAGDPAQAEEETEVELAAHPYAGMEVEAQIVAIDALGQEGASEPLRFTMPERVFLQPLARAAIEIRRHILTDRRAYEPAPRERRRTMPAGGILLGSERIEVRDYDARPAIQRAPDGVRRAARLLDALTMAPEDGYFRDLAVFLGLRTARAQLGVASTIDDTAVAAETLWLTALRAEYGGASDARRALEEAQRQLAEALAQGASPERIQQLMDALRRATERYMQALVQEALREGRVENLDDTEEQASITNADIQEMLREVERLAQEGRMAEAQALLAMLAGILANMEVQLSEGGGEGEGGESQNQALQQSIDQLGETMGDQRALRDETRQEGQSGGGEQQGGQGGAELAARQEGIRQGLAEAQRMAEDAGSAAPSDDLNAAGEAMRRAENALRRGDLEGAARAQDAALNELREGAEALAAELRDRGREGQQRGGAEGQDRAEGSERDPLGRGLGNGEVSLDGDLSGGAVTTREILDEIRRRAEDPTRPEAERAYLRRLLDRFGGGS